MALPSAMMSRHAASMTVWALTTLCSFRRCIYCSIWKR
ncbi:hypothetical protein BMA10247_A0375 [Burkholderia mallei NCTC 10247]|nr:hypothetical protein BMA10247_A0375 [Burkholderia mallei NCTC 10247]